MKRIYPLSALLLLGPILSAGCSGGHDSCCSTTSKSTARQRAIVSIRITRATLAVAGFARRVTRAASINMGNRVSVWLAAIKRGRDATTPTAPALDLDTGLYYTVTVNADGSGQEDLFVDMAGQKTAGAFTLTAPVWTGGQSGAYPATIQTVYQITAGAYAGEHGTITVTADDATGDNGTLEVDLTDTQGEHCITDFTIVNGVLTAKAHCTASDNTNFDEVFSVAAGIINCTTTYADGGAETITVNPDGSDTETLTSPTGQQEATGSINSSGDDTINYDDGSSETVNVDTGDDSGNDSGGDSSDDAVKRAAKRVTSVPSGATPRKK